LTDSVNFMARNLTNKCVVSRKIVTAVARGDLNQKLLVKQRGIGELADTINNMIDTLATFAESGNNCRARGRRRGKNWADS